MVVYDGSCVVVSRRVFLPRHTIKKSQIVNDLVLVDQRQDDFKTRNDLICFRELSNGYEVPKAYGKKYINKNNLKFRDDSLPGDKIRVGFKGTLRATQVPVVEKTMDALRKNQGAVLNLYCGFGKTTCANFVSSKLKLKTLILVHTSALAFQWRSRILDFVDGASVGMIRQSTFDVDGRTHVIGLMQSISKREYPSSSFDSFGLMIVDECHHVCADQLSKCIDVAGTKYRLGLSATPFRKDGFDQFLWHAIGDVAVTETRDHKSQNLAVEFVRISSPPGAKVHFTTRSSGKRTVNISRMVSDLCDPVLSSQRYSTIVDILKSKLDEKRHIIVLSDRRHHLEKMASDLRTVYGVESGFLVGGQKDNVNKRAEKFSIIFATYSYTSEGVDIPSLDTAVFATPRADIVQTTGRILRDCPTKKSPLVVDIVDSAVVFRNQMMKRQEYYKSLGAIFNRHSDLQT